MATLTIHDLDPATEAALQSRAIANGRSIEREAQDILADATATTPPEIPGDDVDLAEAIRRRMAPIGFADDLVLPPRQPTPRPIDFET